MSKPLLAVSLLLLVSCGSSTDAPSAPTPAALPSPQSCAPVPPQSRVDLGYTTGASYSTVAISFWVGPDPGYCAAAGFTDGGSFCPLRVQGATACELSRVGIAEDTRLPGPTWTLTRGDGSVTFCTGPASGCAHTADPFQVNAYASGTYRACIADASCGWMTVIRP